ncbi:MAG TPA: hypothetical protein VGJ15_10800 [Pirellulales bacterium]
MRKAWLILAISICAAPGCCILQLHSPIGFPLVKSSGERTTVDGQSQSAIVGSVEPPYTSPKG